MSIKIQNKKQLLLGLLTLVIFWVVSYSLSGQVVFAGDPSDIKDSIDSIEKKIGKEQDAKKKLETELASIQSSVYSTQAQIDKARILIKESEEHIARMEKEVALMSDKVELQREFLKNFIQEVYYRKKEPVISVALFKGDFARVFGTVDNFLTIEERILQIAQEIKDTKEKIETEQEQIVEAKADREELLQSKVVQQYGLLAERNETQSDIKEKEATIGELREKLAELQSDLSALTGKSYDAKDIQEAVEYASKNTGVPKGVLYGFLKMETNLGANTGQCTYDDVEKGATKQYETLVKKAKTSAEKKKWQASIDLLERRKSIFDDLVKELDYSKNKKVSCNPRGYIGQGGAMGIPQFMADVWRGYESSIRAKTGHKTPDPWNLTDGVMAMALKLQKAGANSDKESVIKQASISYLGTFYANYYNGIVYWSKNYKRLFND